MKIGLSQNALGELVGRSHAQISNIELGRTTAPPAELLTALATELGDDPADYLRLAGRVSLTAAGVIPGDRSPTGRYLTDDQLEALLTEAAKRAVRIVLDELGQGPAGPAP